MKHGSLVKILSVVLIVFVFIIFGLWHCEYICFPPEISRVLLTAEMNLYRPIYNSLIASTIKLSIKFHRQEHSLSCEIAALKTALSAFNIDVAESELLLNLVFDPTIKYQDIWGDPHSGFVGNIDGKMMVTGYGVYWDPIAYLGLRYKRTEVLQDGTLKEIIEQLDAGRPMVIWGYVGSGQKTSWSTLSGKQIDAVHGEHARVLYGYSGGAEDPNGFYVMDPIYGELYWSKDYFLKQWDTFGRKTVVVYNQPRWVKTPNHYMVYEISKDAKTSHALRMQWHSFVEMGGYLEAIQVITEEELQSYETGLSIWRL